VVVLDKAAEVANTSRAAVIHARTLEVLRAIDVSDELVRRGVVVPRFTVRDGTER
jgi:2-polyprenyl-6-methoxyphenol hydroxylase-like FAD-dependent oxidoreductase